MKCRFEAVWRLGLIGVSVGALACAQAREVDGTRYQVFVDRNPFGLRPPPTNAPPAPPPVAPTPPVNVNLTGISEFRGVKKAWLVVPPVPGKTTNTQYISVMEGEKRDDIEVLEIDTAARTVKILNAGTPATLDFEANGLAMRAPAGHPAARRTPGARPTARATPLPRPSTTITPAQAAASRRAGVTLPTRTVSGMAGPQPTAPTLGSPLGTPAATLRTLPARNLRTSSVRTVEPTPTIDPAEQVILMKAHEAAAQAQGLNYPPMPPVPGID